MGRQISNDFSWSKSRHEKLNECLRAYYLYYYRSWGGWERTAAEDVKTLYGLKKLHNRFTWAGSTVHEAIREALLHYRARRPVDPNAVIDRVHRRMQDEWKHSNGGQHWRDRKTFVGLVEHEYRDVLEPDAWKKNWELTREALTWFFQSRWPTLAQGLPRDRWIEVDETDFDRSVFYLDGVKVFAVPDFAYFDEDGSPRVVDWKTGGPRDGYDDQVLGYALYLADRYKMDLGAIRTSLVYLNAGTEKEVACTAEAVERFKASFRGSVARMRALLVDPSGNEARGEEAFPLKENAADCAGCVFRRPCGRESSGIAKVG
ncbi:MAG: hypothetical protein RL653_1370 [Pseudomonadota bacterium]|jgi:hypothetical protein